VTLGIINKEFVYFIGMGHGILFMLYFVASLFTSHKQAWSVLIWLMIILASIIPFAFIPVEFFLKKEMRKLKKR